uniref:Uncharacterized protein n=1 Tax=Vespula pensylvanica TaxID=30213 RepID=A0A834UBR1_VESPE|nr:hypothetical protein H0235_005516 [Vespula pensylvanica]
MDRTFLLNPVPHPPPPPPPPPTQSGESYKCSQRLLGTKKSELYLGTPKIPRDMLTTYVLRVNGDNTFDGCVMVLEQRKGR